jgi:hypothetical protein
MKIMKMKYNVNFSKNIFIDFRWNYFSSKQVQLQLIKLLCSENRGLKPVFFGNLCTPKLKGLPISCSSGTGKPGADGQTKKKFQVAVAKGGG